jgi:hypothetical protein
VDWKRQANIMDPMKSRPLTARFFLWGFIKNHIYTEKIQVLRHLQVTPEVLFNKHGKKVITDYMFARL